MFLTQEGISPHISSKPFFAGKYSYKDCVNATALSLIQVMIMFCFMAILSSLFSFILDIIAPRKRPMWKIIKRYAFGYIVTGTYE